MFAATALDHANHRAQRLVRMLFLMMTVLLIVPVIAILGILFYRGSSVLSLSVLFTNPEQGMTAGGVFPALLGTILLVTTALIF